MCNPEPSSSWATRVLVMKCDHAVQLCTCCNCRCTVQGLNSFPDSVRGAFSNQGFAEPHKGIQEDDVEDERDCEECKVESWREARHTEAHDKWMVWRELHLEPMSRATLLWVQRNTRKCDLWGCSVHTRSRLQQMAISCKRSCYNKFKKWAPPVFIPLPPWRTGRRRRMPPLVLMKRDWFRSLFSRFAVETVHNCGCFSEVWSEFHRCVSAWFVQWNVPVCLTSLVLLRGWTTRMVFLCQFVHLDALLLGPANFELRITTYWISLEAIVKFIKKSFWYISSAHCGPRTAVSVPQFCIAKHHEVAPSWWRSAGLREYPVAIGEKCGCAINNSLIPIKMVFWPLHFWNCFA